MADPQPPGTEDSGIVCKDANSSGTSGSTVPSNSSNLLETAIPLIPKDERPPNIVGRSIRRQIENSLSGVEQAGSYVVFEELREPVDPKLHVDGLGTIKLPLSKEDAKSIITKCRQSPFGTGTETVVDESVRKTWQLDASQFEVQNPQWETELKNIMSRISVELGFSAVDGENNIRAEPYKVLVYEEGAFFKPHSDSEKVKGMFGTLVVCLPSQHQGGEVVVKHSGSTKTLETSRFSESGYSFGAWYSDVVHEVKPVTSGYRFVLTYNLVQDNPSQSLSAEALDEATIPLRNALDLWALKYKQGIAGVPERLAYFLSHKYTEPGLRIDLLKGQDQLQVRCLKEACAQKGFLIYLASLERRIMGGIDESDPDEFTGPEEDYMPQQRAVGPGGTFHHIDDIYDDDITLTYIVVPNGTLIGSGIEIGLDDIVQDDPFGMPDEEDYSGFTGNEGVSNTLFYRSTVAIILPRACKVPFLFKGCVDGHIDTEVWMRSILESSNSNEQQDLSSLCTSIIASNKMAFEKPWYLRAQAGMIPMEHVSPQKLKLFSGAVLEMVIYVALRDGNFRLFEEAVAAIDDGLPQTGWHSIGFGGRRHGLDNVLNGMNIAVSKIQRMHLRFAALDEIVLGYVTDQEDPVTHEVPKLNAEELEQLKGWKEDKINDTLASAMTLVKGDSSTLVQKILAYDNRFLFDKVLPLLKREISNTPFILSFFSSLADATKFEKLPLQTVRTIFHDVASDVIDNLNFSLPAQQPKRQRRYGGGWSSYTPTKRTLPPGAITGDELGKLLTQSDHLVERTTDLDGFLDRVLREAEECHEDMFEVFFLPSVRALLSGLTQAGVSLQHEPFNRYIQSIMRLYMSDFVGPEPLKPQDWERGKRGCGAPRCEDCLALDAFLVNPGMREARFSVSRNRREHLQMHLKRVCETRTETMEGERATRAAGRGGRTARAGRRREVKTLVVVKGDGEWEGELEWWRERCGVAAREVVNIGEERLEEVFCGGEEEDGKEVFREMRERLRRAVGTA